MHFEPNPPQRRKALRAIEGDHYVEANNITAKKSDDGSVAIQFGGDPKDATNYLPITPGWNYTVRLYRPRKEILDGTWKFPEPQPVP